MSEEKKNYCPTWLFKIISCVIVFDYIVRDRAIFFSLKKFTSYLSKKYDNVDSSEIETASNLIIQFLGELKIDKNTYLLINHFMYNIIRDTKPAEKGLLKKDQYNGTKSKEYSVDELIQEFRVFCFACRSGLTRKSPAGWDIVNDNDLGEFREVLASEFSIDDMIDNLIQ